MVRLAILIPTYNREQYLIKNLLLLKRFILELNIENEVGIIISNNASADNTKESVNKIIESNSSLSIQLYNQESNIGLENNALFVLQMATSPYVMYLGDDDFIAKEYLLTILEHLRVNDNLSCIIPSFENVDIEGNKIGSARDVGMDSKIYTSGFDNCLINSYRGHQLSGLVMKKRNLLESYRTNKVNNLYPFIYFVSYSCLNGDTWHFTDYPVHVTAPLQIKKDWDYNINGLVTEIFDNYKKLPGINLCQRHQLEFKILKEQKWRYEIHLQKSKMQFAKSIYSIVISDKTSLLTKIIFPSFILAKMIRKFVRKCLP